MQGQLCLQQMWDVSCLEFFTFACPIFFLILSSFLSFATRLKYCSKELLNPIQPAYAYKHPDISS